MRLEAYGQNSPGISEPTGPHGPDTGREGNDLSPPRTGDFLGLPDVAPPQPRVGAPTNSNTFGISQRHSGPPKTLEHDGTVTRTTNDNDNNNNNNANQWHNNQPQAIQSPRAYRPPGEITQMMGDVRPRLHIFHPKTRTTRPGNMREPHTPQE